MKIRLLILLLGLIGLTGLTGGLAVAGTHFGSKVTIHLPRGGDTRYLFGLVSSDKAACKSHRRIKIVQDPDGVSGYQDYATGIRTHSDGTWSYGANPDVVNGYYKAVALRKTIPSGVCTVARSRALFVD